MDEANEEVPEISVEEALAHLEAGDAVFVDVRDEDSFRRAHIPGARNVGDHNLEEFLGEADKQQTTIVCCYQGNSSLGGTAYFLEHGFREVFSMEGGMAAWHGNPLEETPAPAPAPSPPTASREAAPPVEPEPPRRGSILGAILRMFS